MKKQLLLVMLCAGMFCGTEAQGQETERLSGYVQAERFTKEKLNTMLFSTSVDPHWFQKGNNFWYEYKTSNGKAWYVVDPVAKTKRSLFDLDDIAAQITEIVKDPFSNYPSRSSKQERTDALLLSRSPLRKMLKKTVPIRIKVRRKRYSFSPTTIPRVN